MRAEPVASRLYAQTVVEHERRLPEAGKVLVASGDWVQSDQVIALCEKPGRVRVVDAAAALGVARDRLPECLRVAAGQVVEAGEVLATSGFMGWRTVRAPVSGRVAEVAAGRVFVEEPGRSIEVRANLPGRVLRVLPGRGAVIRATVSRVVGAWGCGDETFGPLALRTGGPGDTLNWISVDLACRGKIVVGGQCLDKRALLRAARFRALGLVVGGLAEHLRPRVRELGLTVVVTDGLGAVPMAEPVFELLASHKGREALLDGGEGAGPPAVTISLDSIRGPVNLAPERPLTVGDRVRLTRAPHLGVTGWVKGILDEDGETWVEVRLGPGESTTVAYRNLERLG
jgi:hypothetical protein